MNDAQPKPAASSPILWVSVGIENAEDIIADLDQALR